jgi:hypothetical protein
MCKNYSHRLEEWIKYNIKLGFSGIVIFDNETNEDNNGDPQEYCIKRKTTKEICENYKDKVFLVKFPYSPLKNNHWNTIQRMSLHIGVNCFKDKCRHIALIDADEFIYLPKEPSTSIETFLEKYNNTVTIKSNILTNKNYNDIIDNNVLKLAEYVGEDKYTKTILNTKQVKDFEFIFTPHNHYSEIKLEKNEIIHYHCWLNNRYSYNESMQKIDYFTPFNISNDNFFHNKPSIN